MGLIGAYNEFLQHNRIDGVAIAAGGTMLAMLTGGAAVMALRSGDILGGLECSGLAIGFGVVAAHAAIEADSLYHDN